MGRKNSVKQLLIKTILILFVVGCSNSLEGNEASQNIEESTSIPTATATVVPLLFPSPTANQETLKSTFRPLIGGGILLQGTCEGMIESANKRNTEESSGFEAFGEIFALGIFLNIVDEGFSDWEAPSDVLDIKEELDGHTDEMKDILSRWLDDEIDSSEVLELGGPICTEIANVIERIGIRGKDMGISAATLEEIGSEIADSFSEMDIEEINPEVTPEITLDTETPNPDNEGEVSASNVTSYEDEGTLHFIGLVENHRNVDIEFVKIHVLLRDEQGVLTESEYSYSDREIIPIGEYSTFDVVFFDDVPAWTTYEISVESEENDFAENYTDFEVISSTGQIGDFYEYEIFGELRNSGESDAEFVTVIAALYDSQDALVGVDYSYSEFDVVSAGGTSPFEIGFFSLAGDEVARYELFVEAEEVD